MGPQVTNSTYNDDFTVGCICPLGVELAPVLAMLDETYRTVPSGRDTFSYILGRIGAHKVVIATLPEIGNNRAATVASHLLHDFKCIRFGLLVGIGGGIPSTDNDIRLGDVVVSKATDKLPAVVQLDLGRRTPGGSFSRTGSLGKPPPILMDAIQRLSAMQKLKGSQISRTVEHILEENPRLRDENYNSPGLENDKLYEASCTHVEGVMTCDICDHSQLVSRPQRSTAEPRIFYGPIGSGNAVIRDSEHRTALQKEGFLCVEMEAAGLMDDFNCLVIRGVCDYADSHKNKRWQPYAAATAAAYMKELLLAIPPLASDDSDLPPCLPLKRQVSTIPQSAPPTRVDTAPPAPKPTRFKTMPRLHIPKQRRSRLKILSPSNEIWTVPLLPPPQFVGREAICARIRSLCFAQQSPIVHHESKIFSLYGLPGSGKSAICLKLAWEFRERFWAVLWIDASSKTAIERSYREIAYDQGLVVPDDADPLYAVVQFLAASKQPWLLIFDNADDTTLHLNPFFPINSKGLILISSRNTEVRNYATLGHEEIGCMPPDEACNLFTTTLKKYDPSNKISKDHSFRVVEAVGFLTVAILQAGTHIGKGYCTAVEYPKTLRQDPSSMFALKPPTNSPNRGRAVYEILDGSADHIKSLGTQIAMDALELMVLFAFINKDEVSEKMMESAWKAIHSNRPGLTRCDTNSRLLSLARSSSRSILIRSDDQSEWCGTAEKWDREATREALLFRASMSLITINDKSFDDISVHPVVHAWMFDRLEKSSRQEAFLKTCWTLQLSLQPALERTAKDNQRSLRHILACLECPGLTVEFARLDDNDFDIIAKLLKHVAWLGSSKPARFLAKKWSKAVTSSPEYETGRTVAMMNLVIRCHDILDQLIEAEQVAQHAVRIAAAANGDYHPNTILQLWHLAQQLNRLENYQQAMEIIEPTLEGGKPADLPADQHGAALATLAWSYYKTENIDHAIAVMIQAIEIYDEYMGLGAAEVAGFSENLCRIYHEVGKHQKAANLAKPMYAACRNHYGSICRPTLRAQMYHALGLRANGEVDDAMRLLKDCIATQTKLEGANSKDAIQTASALSSLHAERREWTEAELLARRCWDDVKARSRGEEEEFALKTLDYLIYCTAMTYQSAEAASLWEEYWTTRRERYGDEVELMLDAIFQLGISVKTSGQTKEAASTFVECSLKWEKMYSDRELPEAYSPVSLDGFLQRSGCKVPDGDVAEILIEVVRYTQRMNQAKTVQALQKLAAVMAARHLWLGAIKFWEAIYSERKEMYGEEHSSTAATTTELETLRARALGDGKSVPLIRHTSFITPKAPKLTWKVKARSAVDNVLTRTGSVWAAYRNARVNQKRLDDLVKENRNLGVASGSLPELESSSVFSPSELVGRGNFGAVPDDHEINAIDVEPQELPAYVEIFEMEDTSVAKLTKKGTDTKCTETVHPALRTNTAAPQRFQSQDCDPQASKPLRPLLRVNTDLDPPGLEPPQLLHPGDRNSAVSAMSESACSVQAQDPFDTPLTGENDKALSAEPNKPSMMYELPGGDAAHRVAAPISVVNKDLSLGETTGVESLGKDEPTAEPAPAEPQEGRDMDGGSSPNVLMPTTVWLSLGNRAQGQSVQGVSPLWAVNPGRGHVRWPSAGSYLQRVYHSEIE